MFRIHWPTSNEIVGPNSIMVVQGKYNERLRNFVTKAIGQPEALRRIALHLQPRIVAAPLMALKGTVNAYVQTKNVYF